MRELTEEELKYTDGNFDCYCNMVDCWVCNEYMPDNIRLEGFNESVKAKVARIKNANERQVRIDKLKIKRDLSPESLTPQERRELNAREITQKLWPLMIKKAMKAFGAYEVTDTAPPKNNEGDTVKFKRPTDYSEGS